MAAETGSTDAKTKYFHVEGFMLTSRPAGYMIPKSRSSQGLDFCGCVLMFGLVFPACCEKSWDTFKDVT